MSGPQGGFWRSGFPLALTTPYYPGLHVPHVLSGRDTWPVMQTYTHLAQGWCVCRGWSCEFFAYHKREAVNGVHTNMGSGVWGEEALGFCGLAQTFISISVNSILMSLEYHVHNAHCDAHLYLVQLNLVLLPVLLLLSVLLFFFGSTCTIYFSKILRDPLNEGRQSC